MNSHLFKDSSCSHRDGIGPRRHQGAEIAPVSNGNGVRTLNRRGDGNSCPRQISRCVSAADDQQAVFGGDVVAQQMQHIIRDRRTVQAEQGGGPIL